MLLSVWIPVTVHCYFFLCEQAGKNTNTIVYVWNHYAKRQEGVEESKRKKKTVSGKSVFFFCLFSVNFFFFFWLRNIESVRPRETSLLTTQSTFTHSHTYTAGAAIGSNLELSILLNDTLTCWLRELGIELPNFQLVDDYSTSWAETMRVLVRYIPDSTLPTSEGEMWCGTMVGTDI